MKIVSWNVNSVRKRLGHIQELIQLVNPDIICLQETKVENHAFPKQAFVDKGYSYAIINGMKSYNGVAVLSKYPLIDKSPEFIYDPTADKARHILFSVEGQIWECLNVYIHAGGDTPDEINNLKFKHKMNFYRQLNRFYATNRNPPQLLLGDFNIAPSPFDVWNHKYMLDYVSHTPIEIETLTQFQNNFNWVDLIRTFYPSNEPLFSWWSYRARDWESSNRGLRLDHAWACQIMAKQIEHCEYVRATRYWQEPSDHIPTLVHLK